MHVSIGTREAEVADRAAVEAAPHRLELLDDLHGADLGRAAERARREGGAKGVEAVAIRGELSAHVRDQMHHVRVALDHELLGHLDRPDAGHAADVVAPEIEQHDVLGDLLRVGRELARQRQVLDLARAARPGARDRPHRHLAVLDARHHLRRGARGLEVVEVEIEHVRRRVQRAAGQR
jgi:hypothetical protein